MTKKKVTITLEENSHLRIKELALKRRKSVSELYEKIIENYITKNEINEIFKAIDTDKNSKIDYTEFLAATLEQTI